jgi:hypothetical protein
MALSNATDYPSPITARLAPVPIKIEPRSRISVDLGAVERALIDP